MEHCPRLSFSSQEPVAVLAAVVVPAFLPSDGEVTWTCSAHDVAHAAIK